jgi:hypothetical protein
MPLTVFGVWVTVVLKEPFSGWRSNYEGRLKSSWTGGSAPLLCFPLHNTDVLPPVHDLFKRPSYVCMYVYIYVYEKMWIGYICNTGHRGVVVKHFCLVVRRSTAIVLAGRPYHNFLFHGFTHAVPMHWITSGRDRAPCRTLMIVHLEFNLYSQVCMWNETNKLAVLFY